MSAMSDAPEKPIRKIRFYDEWGPRSWLVYYDGPYCNNRPPHVQLRGRTCQTNTIYDRMLPGTEYELVNLRKIGTAVMWTVEGLLVLDQHGNETAAHFIVHNGDLPCSAFE